MDHEETIIQEAGTPAPVIPETPNPAPLPKTPRNQHLKVESPKNRQFTGRATEAEHQTIIKAIAARKNQLGLTETDTYDVIRLTLELIRKNNSDFLSSIKTR